MATIVSNAPEICINAVQRNPTARILTQFTSTVMISKQQRMTLPATKTVCLASTCGGVMPWPSPQPLQTSWQNEQNKPSGNNPLRGTCSTTTLLLHQRAGEEYHHMQLSWEAKHWWQQTEESKVQQASTTTKLATCTQFSWKQGFLTTHKTQPVGWCQCPSPDQPKPWQTTIPPIHLCHSLETVTQGQMTLLARMPQFRWSEEKLYHPWSCQGLCFM